MELMGMSFKDFIWENNPTALNVTGERTLRETVLPFAGTGVQDLGPKKRRVTGEGYFTGEDCWQRWGALNTLYRAGGAGSLCLPGQEPFFAVMDELKLIGTAGKELVKYAFSFTECRGKEVYDGAGVHRAFAGETLWDYAYRYGRSIDDMVQANPHIEDIACLKAGEEVRVP